jgi:hypothetical protein
MPVTIVTQALVGSSESTLVEQVLGIISAFIGIVLILKMMYVFFWTGLKMKLLNVYKLANFSVVGSLGAKYNKVRFLYDEEVSVVYVGAFKS